MIVVDELVHRSPAPSRVVLPHVILASQVEPSTRRAPFRENDGVIRVKVVDPRRLVFVGDGIETEQFFASSILFLDGPTIDVTKKAAIEHGFNRSRHHRFVRQFVRFEPRAACAIPMPDQ